MGLEKLRQDVADLASAHDTPTGIRDVTLTSDEERIACTFSHSSLDCSIEVQILVLDVASYPIDCTFVAFAGSQRVSDEIARSLDSISSLTHGTNVSGVLQLISMVLNEAIQTCDNEEETTGFDDASFSSFDGDEDMIDPFSEEDPPRAIPSLEKPAAGASLVDKRLGASFLQRLEDHLREAHELGAWIGSFYCHDDSSNPSCSLSVPIADLGISADSLQAWNLDASHYAVLLLKIHDQYPLRPAGEQGTIATAAPHPTLEYRFGKCAQPKPSWPSVQLAFSGTSNAARADIPGANDEADRLIDSMSNDKTACQFSPIPVLGALDSFMNKHLDHLIAIRATYHLSWDKALHRLPKHDVGSVAHYSEFRSSDANAFDHEVLHEDEELEIQVNPVAHPIIYTDLRPSHSEDINIPLLSLQFALQRLTRCARYCTVCHRTTKQSFEALKPFVCSDSLCLFQYLQLGFGPSVEDEIICNPYVVDLLVSCFAAAVAAGKNREFPVGLGLKSAVTGLALSVGQWTEKHLQASVNFTKNKLTFELTDFSEYRQLKSGDRLLIVWSVRDRVLDDVVLSSYMERHVCRIVRMQSQHCFFEVQSSYSVPEIMMQQLGRRLPNQAEEPSSDCLSVPVFLFNRYLDDLEGATYHNALSLLLNEIPSVLDMRDYLLQSQARRLSTWSRLDRSTSALIRWIIHSNRSLIVQDQPVESDEKQNANVGSISDTTTSDHISDLRGMPSEWLRFRFIQGSPDKEQQFLRELESVMKLDDRRQSHPTMFVWHGSPMANWHSIIRTGLDFAQGARSGVNGVWFSSNFGVSINFAHKAPGAPYGGIVRSLAPTEQSPWRHSQLRPSSAISICELINKPECFVATHPHWVVDKVGWIQCRYLFVEIHPTEQAKQFSGTQGSWAVNSDDIAQDPDRLLVGPNSMPIAIPWSALSNHRQQAMVNVSAAEEDHRPGLSQLAARPDNGSVAVKNLHDDIAVMSTHFRHYLGDQAA